MSRGIVCGDAPDEKPAIAAIDRPQAPFDGVRSAFLGGMLPGVPRNWSVLGVKREFRASSLALCHSQSRVVHPLLAEVDVQAVGRCYPDHMRHGVRQRAKSRFTVDRKSALEGARA